MSYSVRALGMISSAFFAAALALPPQEQGEREAIRFEKAKQAASQAEARKEHVTAQPASKPAMQTTDKNAVAEAIRFEHLKDAEAAAQARRDAGMQTAAHQPRPQHATRGRRGSK